MAITLEELEIKFKAQTQGLTSQLNGIEKQLTGLDSSTANTQKSFSKFGRFAAIGAAAAGAALVKVGADSIKMANDAVESEGLFKVAMGGMEGAARAWSEEMAASLGLNAYEVRKNVGTLNTMFKSMGLGEQQAYDMSTGMTALANDMASFYNLSTEEAFQKLSAGITGETEPLKRLGILVDENTIQQYAMKKGISKTGKEMTQQQKLLARYGAIMEQTTLAQGDLARTAESPTNQIRRLNAQLDSAKIALGTALQPALIAVLPALTNMATGAAKAISALTGTGTASRGAFDDVDLSVSQAAATAAANITSKTSELKTVVDTQMAAVDAAVLEYSTAAQNSKDIYINLKLRPRTTGLVRVEAALLTLDAVVDAKTAEGISSDVAVKMKAALADGTVTKEEAEAILNDVNTQLNDMLKQVESDKDAALADVKVRLESGIIDLPTADAEAAAIQAEYDAKVGVIEGVRASVKTELLYSDWTAPTFSADDAKAVGDKITEEIKKGAAVVVEADATVKALFGGAGEAGQLFIDYYSGLATDAQTLGQSIMDDLTSAMTQPMTPEQMAGFIAKKAEYAKMLEFMTTGIYSGNAFNDALFSGDLSPKGIRNLAAAYSTTASSDAADGQKMLNDLITISNSKAFDPKWQEYLVGAGYVDANGKASQSAYTASLTQNEAQRQADFQSSAILTGGAQLLESVKALDLTKLSAGDISETQSAMYDLLSRFKPETMNADAQGVYKDLLVYASNMMQMAAGLPGEVTDLTLNSPKVVLDKPSFNTPLPAAAAGTGGSLAAAGTGGSLAVSIGASEVALYMDAYKVAKAVIKYLPKVEAQAGATVTTASPAGGTWIREKW